MSEQKSAGANCGDVSKTVMVAAGMEEAFAILVERPGEWLPPGHSFFKEPELIAIEPRVGGRYYERGADGTEVVHGTVVTFEPPHRLVMTWRMGADWRPTPDDEHASLTEFAFSADPDQSGASRVVLTHSQLHRHGPAAAAIHAALDGPSPGDTLARYAEVVARHAAGAGG
ncbi:SRPBCC domain-containing protein [Streptomyces sp. NBC_00631]|uniref:SRPBCC domain-containing protein n=1 Tax=Streptomyces sp. NBC_00631 TaxID=2975793 RepID=UPI0030E01E87